MFAAYTELNIDTFILPKITLLLDAGKQLKLTDQ